MTRKECLEQAMGCVLKDRQNQYGGPENNFERIAQMWNGYLGTNSIRPWDVAAMMGMLKMARARFNPKYADNWVDMAGYAACGIECATAQEDFDKALDEFQKKAMPVFAKKAEGCEALVEHDAPQTPDELCQRIVDSNPANYKPRNLWEGLTRLNIKPTFEPHKTTGEELAEMAEEDEKHG